MPSTTKARNAFVIFLINIFSIASLVHSHVNRPLNHYVTHYEPLDYESSSLQIRHSKRPINNLDHKISLSFSAHNRTFQLSLEPDLSIFTEDYSAELVHGHNNITVIQSHPSENVISYTGHVTGSPGSYVAGTVFDNIFSGMIQLREELFYIERNILHFDDPQTFHSVMYKQSDILQHPNLPNRRVKRSAANTAGDQRSKRDPEDTLEEASGGHCGLSNSVHHWMDDVYSHLVPDNQTDPDKTMKGKTSDYRTTQRDHASEDHAGMYSKDAQNDIYSAAQSHRMKRDTRKSEIVGACGLMMMSDPELYKYIQKKLKRQGIEPSNDRIEHTIKAILVEHAQQASAIYKAAVFPYSDIDYRATELKIQKTKILTTEMCDKNQKSDPYYRFCRTNLDVTVFLNTFSRYDWSPYCIAYMFTYRDFSGGTLGLAWVGKPTDGSGGICERARDANENGQVFKKSLNTGIVTLLNYAKYVSIGVSAITFSHEVGHNFGAEHDPAGQACTPGQYGKKNGNFIMFRSATSGDQGNNRLFSLCSRRQIAAVINFVKNTNSRKSGGYKINCFTASDEPFCGNAIVEPTIKTFRENGVNITKEVYEEECDCGDKAECLKNDGECCNVFGTSKDKNCKLQAGKVCSESVRFKCCDMSTCNPTKETRVCEFATECKKASKCKGTGNLKVDAECPVQEHEDNGKNCAGLTKICNSGACNTSVCTTIQGAEYEVCQKMAPEDNKNFDRTTLCYVSCKLSTGDSTCWSSKEHDTQAFPAEFRTMLEALPRTPTQDSNALYIKLPPSSACDNNRGYCDTYNVCRLVDNDGPLARLRNLLFSEKSLNAVKEWIIANWWAVGLMVLGLIIFMGLFISFCSVHTPSSNPHMRQHRHLAQTLTLNRRRTRQRRNQGGAPAPAPSSRAAAYHHHPENDRPPPYELQPTAPGSSYSAADRPGPSRRV